MPACLQPKGGSQTTETGSDNDNAHNNTFRIVFSRKPRANHPFRPHNRQITPQTGGDMRL